MIKAEQIAEILSLYKKHGWNLRRVLLSDALKKSLGETTEKLFGAAEIRSAEIDAAWFSRSSKPDQETWDDLPLWKFSMRTTKKKSAKKHAARSNRD
jgi:hypothetical protein